MTHEQLKPVLDAQPYRLLFVTISGAHLYGFASDDSDYDLRGVHLLPAEQVLSLDQPQETIEREEWLDGTEIDLVTHDVEKFMRLMLKRNGYVLEQLYSPLVLQTSDLHEQLKELGRGCITRYHVHHYLGFSRNQWQLLMKDAPPRVKPLLYVYRVLLTGIHLMRTGEIEANLPRLNEYFKLTYLDELIERKRTGCEQERLSDADLSFYEDEFTRLQGELERAGEQSTLPDLPASRKQLSDLLVTTRLKGRRAEC